MISDNSKPVKRIYIGDIDDLWCSTCGRKTPHVYGWFNNAWLSCLTCYPAAKEAVKKEEHE